MNIKIGARGSDLVEPGKLKGSQVERQLNGAEALNLYVLGSNPSGPASYFTNIS